MKKCVKIIKLESRKHLSQFKVQANSLILDFKAKKLFCLLMPAVSSQIHCAGVTAPGGSFSVSRIFSPSPIQIVP